MGTISTHFLKRKHELCVAVVVIISPLRRSCFRRWKLSLSSSWSFSSGQQSLWPLPSVDQSHDLQASSSLLGHCSPQRRVQGAQAGGFPRKVPRVLLLPSSSSFFSIKCPTRLVQILGW